MEPEEYGEYHDVYVFAREAEPDLVDGFAEQDDKSGPVRYIAATTGPYAAFAVVELARPQGITDRPFESVHQVLHDTFGNPRAKGLATATPLKVGAAVIRWTKNYAHAAFVGIRVKPGKARQVLAMTSVVDGYNGSAITAGPYDVLVEIGADSHWGLQQRLLEGMHGIAGIAHSETLIVAKAYYRGPREEAQA